MNDIASKKPEARKIEKQVEIAAPVEASHFTTRFFMSKWRTCRGFWIGQNRSEERLLSRPWKFLRERLPGWPIRREILSAFGNHRKNNAREKNMIRQVLKVATLTMILGAAWLMAARAQQNSSTKKKPAETQMQTAQPGPEMEELKFLQGKWRVKATYEKTPLFENGGEGSGTYVARPGPGGFSQIADFQETAGPEGSISGHEVITWDPRENSYKSFVFGSNFPGCVARTGHWEEKNLVFNTDFVNAGMTIHFHSVTTASADGSVTIVESYAMGDAPMQLMLTTKATRE
jgi:Protein of unknown function (DUF1579)